MQVTADISHNIDPAITKRFAVAWHSLRNMSVRIGLPDSETEDGDNITLAQIGIINEFGTEHIPARPFVQRGIARSLQDIVKMLHASLERIAHDDPRTMRARGVTALNRVGAYVTGQIKKGIAEGGFVPNAKSTLDKKAPIKIKIRAHSITRTRPLSKPLIDTGLLRQSITWLVKGAG